MHTRTRWVLRATLVAAAVTGSLATGPVASARQDSPGCCTTADRNRIEELVRTEAICHNATPGSAAQFRAREEAYKLWATLFPTG